MELVFVFEFVFVSGEVLLDLRKQLEGSTWTEWFLTLCLTPASFDHDVIHKVNDMKKYHKAA